MAHPLAGKAVLVRAPGSGVFIGTLVRVSKRYGTTLKDAQRVWAWTGALDTLALASAGPRTAKMSPVVGTLLIPDGRETCDLSDAGAVAFRECGVWNGL
jgi:hypothetical protein